MVDFKKAGESIKEKQARIAREGYHTIIAGSRGLAGVYDQTLVSLAAKRCGWTISKVISGAARGIDSAGERWAKDNNIPVEQFKPDWEGDGKGAGYARNVRMAMVADALIAVWDGKSKGTKHMIKTAMSHYGPKRVFILEVRRWWVRTPSSVGAMATNRYGLILCAPEEGNDWIGRDLEDYIDATGCLVEEAK